VISEYLSEYILVMVSTHTPTITNTPPRYNHLSIIALHTPKKQIPILSS